MSLPPYELVATVKAWDRCYRDLSNQPRLAVDLESNSLYAYKEEVCLIQISTPEKDYIVDPRARLDLDGLGQLLQNPSVEKIFHAAEYDGILMKNQYGWELVNLFDTMWAARILGYERYSLANLLKETYGVTLNKKYQKTNWCRRPLSKAQLIYAQMDTHYLHALRDDLDQELRINGCFEEAQEIFSEQARVNPTNKVFEPEDFWNLNGVRDMTPKKRAVVRALYIYRDEEARKQNRPHFKIYADQTIIELAKLMPKHPEDLHQIYGMSKGQVDRYGGRLLQIVRSAQNDPAPKRPRNNSSRTPKPVASRFDCLHLWRKERARARGVESDVVISRDALWELAWENPKSQADLIGISGLGPWRRATYGDEILRLLSKR